MTTAVHRISSADFDLLASGRGSAATIAALRRGQLSKHMLMLSALDTMATAIAPTQHHAAGFPAAYGLLADVQRVAPEVVSDLLLHPHVGAWLCHCLEQLHDPRPPDYRIRLDLAHFANIAAAAAIRAGVTFRIPVHVHGGRVPLPTVGAALPCGADTEVVRDEHGARVISAGLTVKIPVDGSAASGWLPVRRLTAEAGGHRIILDLEDLDPYRGHNHPAVAGRLSEREVDRWRRLFDEAWALLATDHRDYAAAIAAGLRLLVPQRTDDPHRSISATSTDAFGAIAMSCPADAADFANTLIHEFQHAKLSALLDLVPLANPRPTTRYYAPWRDDPRPLPGLLQGAYAFLGVTDFWRMHRRRAGMEGRNALPDFEFVRWRVQTENACTELLASGDLTNLGERFVRGMQSTLECWRDEPVPADLAEQARDTAAEHSARWRLRNLSPSPADVTELAAAWMTGDMPPPVTESHLHSGASAAHTDAARLQLWHLKMTAPGRFERLVGKPESAAASVPGATYADLCFVHGDIEAAISAYRERIGRSIDAPAWIGLALALRRSGDEQAAAAILWRPELLIALQERLCSAGIDVDPVTLASWLSRTSDGKALLK